MSELNTENNIQRYNPDINFGLSDEQVQSRISQNLINIDKNISTKKTSDIIKNNIFTLFNFIYTRKVNSFFIREYFFRVCAIVLEEPPFSITISLSTLDVLTLPRDDL